MNFFRLTSFNYYNKKALMLPYNEVVFLRLYVLGKTTQQICNYLHISVEQYYALKARITEKFDTQNWLQIIVEAEQFGYIWKDELMETQDKEVIATVIAKQKGYSYKHINGIVHECIIQIQNHYKKLYVSNNIALLSPIQISVLQSMQQGASITDICAELQLTLDAFKALSVSILKKIKQPNWYRAIVFAYRYGLLSVNKKVEETILKTCIAQITKRKKGLFMLHNKIDRTELYLKIIDCLVAAELQVLFKRYYNN